MMNYALSLLAVVLLCAFWGVFQQWLAKRDPESASRPQKCGAWRRRAEGEAPAGHPTPDARRCADESSAIAG